MRKKKREIITECACGERHEYEEEIIKKMGWSIPPDFIECNECPVCSPELLDKPEDHEDEAYNEEVDIEELEKALDDDGMDYDDLDIDEFEDEDYDEFSR
ncbi:MAG: hypothetical protein N2510_05295 [Ignavibacteria bacterium]|nr:hypothetical protein [Ignavibacteria bacterium]